MVRFRPNIVVSGRLPGPRTAGAVRIGEAEFSSVRGVRMRDPTRTRSPASGRRSRQRRWPGSAASTARSGSRTNLVAATPGATIRVGDHVEVIEEVDAAGGAAEVGSDVADRR